MPITGVAKTVDFFVTFSIFMKYIWSKVPYDFHICLVKQIERNVVQSVSSE